MRCDIRQHTVEISQDIIVPLSDQAIALCGYETRPRLIIVFGFIMLAAIDFDDKPRREAKKISEIGADGHLPAKFQLPKSASQTHP